MPNRLALWSTFLLVVLPTTLASMAASVFGLALMLDSVGAPYGPLRERHVAGSAMMLGLLVAGWFGIVTLWRLFVGLLRNAPPVRSRVVWAGLLSGSAASICLVLAMKGGAANLVFAWPLLAALHFGNEFSKTCPMSPRDLTGPG